MDPVERIHSVTDPGGITILVVDDEPDVRAVVADMLREAGYSVLEASSGPEALDIGARHPGDIRLLLTDLIMPGMTGRMLADALGANRPGMAVIFMSGHVDDSRQAAREPGLHYLRKPIDWEKLESMVRDLIEKRTGP
jgi:CheY-like chemotaxis protein